MAGTKDDQNQFSSFTGLPSTLVARNGKTKGSNQALLVPTARMGIVYVSRYKAAELPIEIVSCTSFDFKLVDLPYVYPWRRIEIIQF